MTFRSPLSVRRGGLAGVFVYLKLSEGYTRGMETPTFGGETEEQPERSVRQEKMELADEVVADILTETLARVSERMKEQKTVSLQGREFSILDARDERLAREQLTTADLRARLEQAREKGDYYLQEELEALAHFSQLREDVTVHSAEITRRYPKSAELLLSNDEHRDTP